MRMCFAARDLDARLGLGDVGQGRFVGLVLGAIDFFGDAPPVFLGMGLRPRARRRERSLIGGRGAFGIAAMALRLGEVAFDLAAPRADHALNAWPRNAPQDR